MAHQVAMDRQAQKDYQLYIALAKSVDKDTKGKFNVRKMII
jgi:hypothetical protein